MGGIVIAHANTLQVETANSLVIGLTSNAVPYQLSTYWSYESDKGFTTLIKECISRFGVVMLRDFVLRR